MTPQQIKDLINEHLKALGYPTFTSWKWEDKTHLELILAEINESAQYGDDPFQNVNREGPLAAQLDHVTIIVERDLIESAAIASEMFSEDDLEDHAQKLRRGGAL